MTAQIKSISLLLALTLCGYTTIANPAIGGGKIVVSQQVKCSGVVVDQNGLPIIGASVFIKGTNNGTITDNNGKFTLSGVKEGNTLVVSCIGYKSLDVKYNGTDLKIVLIEDNQALNEVVVTALGIKRQSKALAYNAQELKSDQLFLSKDANFVSSLNGKVAGVTINQSSSGPGSASKVVMRGAKSIGKSNNALYVIDGVPLLNYQAPQGSGQFHSDGSTDSAADINPNDIESITVLTGASAAALYGSAAANGAIIITTKKGKAGKLKLDYSLTGEWGRPLRLPQFQNSYGSDGLLSSWGNPLPPSAPTFDINKFFNTAFTQTHNLSLSGGNNVNQTYVSAGITNSNGLVPNNLYRRLNITARNSTSLLNDRLKIDMGLNYINEYHRNMINQGEYANPLVGAYLMPRSETVETVKQFEKWDDARKLWVQNWNYGQGDYTIQNPYWVAYRNIFDVKRERYVASLGSAFDIKKWSESEKWNISARVNYDKTSMNPQKRYYASTLATLAGKNGRYSYEAQFTKQLYADVLTTANKNFDLWGDNYISLNGTLGASIQDSSFDSQEVSGNLSEKGVPNLFNIFNISKNDAKTHLEPKGWREQTQSIFASAEIGFNSYLYLTLTGRNDWASQLANSPDKSFFYPSVGLSGIITEMLSANAKNKIKPYLSYLKLRASYASVASPFERGLTSPTYKINTDSGAYAQDTYYPIGKLYPERTNSYEVGMSSKWWGGRISLDASLYKTITKNQTIFVEVPPGSGYSGIYIQTGKVQNAGVELSAGLNLGSHEGLFYNTNFSFAYNNNEIKELADNYTNPINGHVESMPYLSKGGLGAMSFILKKGGTLGDIYSTQDLTRDVNGNIFVSKEGALEVTKLGDENAIKLGSVLPRANYGWSHEIGYKNFSIGGLITAREGGKVVSMTNAALDYMGVSQASAEARALGGVAITNAVIPAKTFFTTIGKARLPQYYTYDATNIRLASLHISYKIDRKYLKNIADITLSVVGRNLLFLYCKAPFDPESVSGTSNYVQGLDNFMMPTQKVMGFNVKVSF